MKILQIIDSLAPGGAERMAVNMANTFSENGIENVLVVTRAEGLMKNFLDTRVPYFHLHKKNALDVLAFARLLRIIRQYKPDVIHAHSSSYLWAILSKLFFKKLVVIWHDHFGLSEQIKKGDRPLVSKLSRKINGIVAVNENLKKWNIANTHVPENRIVFLNNFPDIKLYPSKPTNHSEINIICLTNFKPEKDHQLLIHAFNKLVHQLPQNKIALWLAGNSSIAGNPINNLIAELGLTHKVHILGAVQNTKELLSQAHIGVLSSYSEGLPVSLLEYGLAGLPVLVTNVGQCSDVVGNGECGWVVNPHDVDGFAEALLYIIQHPEEAVLRGKKLRERILTNYGPEKFVQEYSSFLKTVLVAKRA